MLIATIVSRRGYGDRDGNNTGHIAVAESWGFFIGPTFNRAKYAGNFNISNNALNFLERQQNSNEISVEGFNGVVSRGWIPWGIHHDLIDVGEPGVTQIIDGVNGYTMAGIFRGFNENTTTIGALRNSILANNNNLQQTQVNTLVQGYGW